MRLDRLIFEFNVGIDPLTGAQKPPVKVIVTSDSRYDLYYVAEEPKGHECDEILCRDIVPVLARKGNYVLVSYNGNRVMILNEDDSPIQLMPLGDGTWVGIESILVPGGSIPKRLMELDPSRDLYENLRRAWAAQVEWRVPARELTKNCDRIWRI